MSESIRTSIIALAVVVIIAAGSYTMFARPTYTPEALVTLERTAGAVDILLDRDYASTYTLVLVVQQNYEALDDGPLKRRLRPCGTAADLLSVSLARLPLWRVGSGYEALGECLQALGELRQE